MNPEGMVPPIGEPEGSSLAREIGVRLLNVSVDVLTEQLGREPDSREFADMVETMASNLLSSAYLELRSRDGAEAAEKWLRKALVQVSAVIRGAGSDALVKIDLAIKDVPNRLIKQPPAKNEEKPAPVVPTCACEKKDGRCETCLESIISEIDRVYGVIVELKKFKESPGICPVCSVTEFDRALSASVSKFWKQGESFAGEAREEFAKELIGVLSTMAAFRGLKEIPLTLQAWKERAEK